MALNNQVRAGFFFCIFHLLSKNLSCKCWYFDTWYYNLASELIKNVFLTIYCFHFVNEFCLLSPTLLLQEDVVKLTEKCGLSSAGSSSPVATPRRTPEELKSNILKAQAEAAALKVSNRTHISSHDWNKKKHHCQLRCMSLFYWKCVLSYNIFFGRPFPVYLWLFAFLCLCFLCDFFFFFSWCAHTSFPLFYKLFKHQ